jgi:30S ribosomal protein S31
LISGKNSAEKTVPATQNQPGGSIFMGKGDKRSRKGKIWRGTHGNTRPRNKTAAAPTPAKGKSAKKK